MRSHPYESPPPLPQPLSPFLDSLSTMLPSAPSRTYQLISHSRDDSGDIPLASLDPETSRLIRPKRHTHRVWVQGRLAPVRTVSTTSLRNATPKFSDILSSDLGLGRGPIDLPGSPLHHEHRRHSLDNASGAADPDVDDDVEDDYAVMRREARQVAYQSSQLRGYGIGGAGNIRRPTDVIHGPTRPPWYSPSSSDPDTPDPDKPRFSFRELLGRKPDRKGKSRSPSTPALPR